MPNRPQPPRPAQYDKKVGLALQGGGALGSYQAGVFEALAGSDYVPDWVAGISIGAINAAIIAGNPAATRVARLREFWEGITAPPAFWPPGFDAALAGMVGDPRAVGAAAAVLFGQAGFFAPRAAWHWWAKPGPVSYYDTAALKGTLERLVDFDRVNAGEIRISLGAVEVCSSRLVHFDSAEIRIRPEHVMASAALPPGFPAVEIDGVQYWDGGLVSNTPLQYMLDYVPRRSRLTFQVDVFPSAGRLPLDLAEVEERGKDIRFASRSRKSVEDMRRQHDLRHAVNELLEKLPPDLRDTREAHFLYRFGCVTTMDIANLLYRPAEPQGRAKDHDFSRATMAARWTQGRADAERTLRAAPWLAPMPPELGARSFDVSHDTSAALG
jgi:NTE family protein